MKLSTHPLAQLAASDPAVETPMDQALILRLRVSLAGLLTKGDQFAATGGEDAEGVGGATAQG